MAMDAAMWGEKLRALGVKGKIPGVLTQKIVDEVQRREPGGDRCFLADGKIPGMALDVLPNGSAAFVLQVRTRAGVARRCGLGSAASVTLRGARDEAERLRAMVKAGGDPTLERREERLEAKAAQASTVRRYLEDTYYPALVRKNLKSAKGTKNRILATWTPLLDTPLAQLSAEAIEKVIQARKSETNPDGSPRLTDTTHRREWDVFRAMLNDAKQRKAIARMPIEDRPEALRGMREEPRRRYLGMRDSPEEIENGAGERGRFFKALAKFESKKAAGGEYLRVACILALNTGCRRGELVQLRDNMLRLRDEGNERIELPGRICKGGKPRDLYLNPDALAAIARWLEVRKTLKVQSVDGAVFPGKAKMWADRLTQREFPRLCREAGIENLIYKDLRCTFGSLHVQGGTSIHEVMKLMGHQSITTTEKHYAYLAPSAGRNAARAFRVG